MESTLVLSSSLASSLLAASVNSTSSTFANVLAGNLSPTVNVSASSISVSAPQRVIVADAVLTVNVGISQDEASLQSVWGQLIGSSGDSPGALSAQRVSSELNAAGFPELSVVSTVLVALQNVPPALPPAPPPASPPRPPIPALAPRLSGGSSSVGLSLGIAFAAVVVVGLAIYPRLRPRTSRAQSTGAKDEVSPGLPTRQIFDMKRMAREKVARERQEQELIAAAPADAPGAEGPVVDEEAPPIDEYSPGASLGDQQAAPQKLSEDVDVEQAVVRYFEEEARRPPPRELPPRDSEGGRGARRAATDRGGQPRRGGTCRSGVARPPSARRAHVDELSSGQTIDAHGRAGRESPRRKAGLISGGPHQHGQGSSHRHTHCHGRQRHGRDERDPGTLAAATGATAGALSQAQPDPRSRTRPASPPVTVQCGVSVGAAPAVVAAATEQHRGWQPAERARAAPEECARAASGESPKPSRRPADSSELKLTEVAIRMLKTNQPQAIRSLRLAHKLLFNVLRAPEDPRYRRVRLAHPQIADAMRGDPQALEVLEHIGFKVCSEPRSHSHKPGREDARGHEDANQPTEDRRTNRRTRSTADTVSIGLLSYGLEELVRLVPDGGAVMRFADACTASIAAPSICITPRLRSPSMSPRVTQLSGQACPHVSGQPGGYAREDASGRCKPSRVEPRGFARRRHGSPRDSWRGVCDAGPQADAYASLERS